MLGYYRNGKITGLQGVNWKSEYFAVIVKIKAVSLQIKAKMIY